MLFSTDVFNKVFDDNISSGKSYRTMYRLYYANKNLVVVQLIAVICRLYVSYVV